MNTKPDIRVFADTGVPAPEGVIARIVGVEGAPVDVRMSAGKGRWSLRSIEPLLAVIDGVPSWRNDLDAALGNRPLSLKQQRLLRLSLRCVDELRGAFPPSAGETYEVALTCVDETEWDNTIIVGAAGEALRETPHGLTLRPEDGSYASCIRILKRCSPLVEIDLVETLQDLPPTIALTVLRIWDAMLKKQQCVKEVPVNTGAPYRGSAAPYFGRVPTRSELETQLRYVIATLEYGVPLHFWHIEANGTREMVSVSPVALARHLQMLGTKALPHHLGLSVGAVLSIVRDALGLVRLPPPLSLRV